MIAIVVAFFTAGAGTAALGTTTATAAGGTTTALAGTALATTTAAGAISYTTAGVVLNAAVTTLASQAAVSLINNGGDLGQTLKDLGSKESLKQLATSIVTAGVLNEVGKFNFGSAETPFKLNDITVKNGFIANAGKNLVTGLARATINSALTGTDLETLLKTEAIAGILNAASAQGAKWVGDQAMEGGFFINDAGKVNEFGRAFAHAVVGCMAGAAGASASGSNTSTGSGCGAGALGAVVGEFSAQLYGAVDPAKTIAFASMMSGIAAAAAGQGPEGIAIAAGTGANAAQNNWLNHADAAQLAKLKQKRQAGQCDTACDQSIAGLELLDKLNNRALLNACVNGTVAECTAQVKRDPAALKYGVDNAGKIAWGRSVAQAGNNANKALASLGAALEKTELKPLVDANGFVTGWAVDLGGADPDTLRHWLGAGVFVGSAIILPTSAIELIPGAGKGLKVVTQGAGRVVVEEASGKVLGKIEPPPPGLGGVANKPVVPSAGGTANSAQGEKLATELSELARYKPDTRFDAIYSAKTDQNILKDNNFDMDHVLSGEINPRGAATGYHAEFAANGAARIAPDAPIKFNANGTYVAPVQVYDASKGKWVDKFAKSTFFPPSWSQARIEYEVSEAFKKGSPGTRFIETSPGGIPIQFSWDIKNQRTTFYPLGNPKP